MATRRTMYERTLDKGLAVNNVAKALAYYVFREIIEDIHAEYDIPQEKMMALNKKAVNRAAAFLECIGDNERLATVVNMYSLETTGWDNPKETADTRKFREIISEMSETLHSAKGKTNSELYGEIKK